MSKHDKDIDVMQELLITAHFHGYNSRIPRMLKDLSRFSGKGYYEQ